MAEKETAAQVVGAVAPWAIGGYALYRLITRNPQAKRLRNQEGTIRARIKQELENPDGFSDAELQAHIDTHKNIVRQHNKDLPSDQSVDIQSVESELQGEPLETRALAWKDRALRTTLARLNQELDENQFLAFMSELPPWVQNWLSIGAKAVSITAFVAIINRLIDFGRGGGGGIIALLRDWTHMVREGIIGSRGVLDTISRQPAPEEQPGASGTGTPSVSGSPRAVAQAVGMAADTLVKMLDMVEIPADEIVTLGAGVVEMIVDATDLTMQDARDNPEYVLALALAIAAGGAAAAADGPLPIGDAAGYAIIVTVAGVIGVTLNRQRILDIRPDVHSAVA